jgi:hypothetical protein
MRGRDALATAGKMPALQIQAASAEAAFVLGELF